MKRIHITDDEIKRARNLYDFGRLKDSITKGKSNVYGALGEIIIYDRYFDQCQYAGSYDYDLIIKGQKVDVKTKKTTVDPQPHYFATIADANTSQDCDYYCFVRVDQYYPITKKAWILGWKQKEDFFNEASFYKKGDKDPLSEYGWTFKGDCWNLEVSKLD